MGVLYGMGDRVSNGFTTSLTPTLTYSGIRPREASACTEQERHLEIRRRRTSPTAIGRRSPPFFWKARRIAPQRWGVTSGGTQPASARFTTPDSDRMAWVAWSGQGHHTASIRWFTLRLDGPAAEPPEKDFKALMTSSSEMVAGVEESTGGAAWGCLVSMSSNTLEEEFARPPEVRT